MLYESYAYSPFSYSNLYARVYFKRQMRKPDSFSKALIQRRRRNRKQSVTREPTVEFIYRKELQKSPRPRI